MENVVRQLKAYTQELKDERDGYKADYQRLLKKAEEMAKVNERLRDANKPMPAYEWHDDLGDVIWWRLPIEEPPYIGSPLCEDFTFDYYTHFTRLVMPLDDN